MSDKELYVPVYDFDGLRTDPRIIHNHDFMRDPKFSRAYQRGVEANRLDHKYYWRVHTVLWAARHALNIEGDFVECGVNRGMLSSAIVDYLDWNSLNKSFYLFDTFNGIDESQVTEEEFSKGNMPHFRMCYEECYDDVVKNFINYDRINIIKGSVPSTLNNVSIDRVAFLSIDMNNATPEIAAVRHFWPLMSSGAMVVLDDYGFVSYEAQKRAHDALAEEFGVSILALPTGQGVMLKP